MVTLYDTLGVREDATEEEVKRAYRKAAMRSHPDRNVGNEAAAHATFQQVKEAYAILSDPEQRRVYDAVFAEEMQRLARRREKERRRAQAEAARQEAEYAAFVTLAMRYAEQGHNRDVLFGVLLGRACEATLAARIADGVAALQTSRKAQPAAASAEKGAANEAAQSSKASEALDARTDHGEAKDPLHPNLFSTLWHGMFGLRS